VCVSGRIINADGEPAAQATVQVYTYQYSNGQRTLAEGKSVQTNDLGEYRLFWLSPGEYFISVTDSGSDDDSPVGVTDVGQNRGGRGALAGLRVLSAIGDRGGNLVQALTGSTTPPVFYPGTIDPDAAIPITVLHLLKCAARISSCANANSNSQWACRCSIPSQPE
jgi:hypothetical protein